MKWEIINVDKKEQRSYRIDPSGTPVRMEKSVLLKLSMDTNCMGQENSSENDKVQYREGGGKENAS